MTNLTTTAQDEHACPSGVDWCEQHDVLDVVDEDGHNPERHTRWLYTHYAPAVPETPAVALYVSGVDAFTSGPGMALRSYDDPAMSIEPDQARALAAALLEGAAIVEAARTAVCPGCSRRVTPATLEESGECFRCEGERRVARRSSMRLVQS